MKRTLVAVLLLWLLCPSAARAQELLPSVWQYYLEQLSDEGDDETAEDMLELYESLHDTPSNLNDTVALLSVIPFVSDLQRERLRLYIKMYGVLLSVDELYAINGFDSLTVELLRPIVKAEPLESSQHLTLKELLTHGRSNLVMGIGGTVEQARGYRDSIYEGDNLRLMWRYRYKYKDRIQFQLSADKDPGEAFFAASQRRGFDFYGYSLLVNDMARWRSDGTSRNVYIKRFVAGQYHLQFGQGLTLWSGFGPRMTMNTGINRYAQGLRPAPERCLYRIRLHAGRCRHRGTGQSLERLALCFVCRPRCNPAPQRLVQQRCGLGAEYLQLRLPSNHHRGWQA